MRLPARLLTAAALLPLAACAGGGGVECAPYARQVSGIQLYGDAAAWWDQAEGRYARASQPSPGAVLVFRRTGRLPDGHVSTVTQVVSSRDIRVNDANWVHGRISSDEAIVDVSPGNDWSAVRVWWAPSASLGITTYPTFGFILPQPPATAPLPAPVATPMADAGTAGRPMW